VDMLRGQGSKKQKIQFAMEEAELRSLQVPSSAYRGLLSPSKNSYLPTLREQAQDRMQQLQKRERQRQAAVTSNETQDSEGRLRLRQTESVQEQLALSDISTEQLDSIKRDFELHDGCLDLEQFVRAMLRSLRMSEDTQYTSPRKPVPQKVSFQVESDAVKSAPSREPASAVSKKAKGASRDISRTAAVIELFRGVDVHGEGFVTWDEVSNYLIEHGLAGNDEFTVNSIKTYEPSPVEDPKKHDTAVEKLVYLEEIDALVCMSQNDRHFRLYDPRRCTVRHDVAGHRGTVVNCCYVDEIGQIATTSADMTVCLWDGQQLTLRNRMPAKDVQLCLQWDANSRSLFSGSIDGTLSRWDIDNMCLAETSRKSKKPIPINDLLMIKDINLLASASSDGNLYLWDVALLKTKKTFKGPKKGIFSLSYSPDYQCLLTAGIDKEALVWNPYVEKLPIFRLNGHVHALCGITAVPGTPQILTADVKGFFCLWDMRNFRCVQSFGGGEGKTETNTFCAIPPHNRVAAGGAKVVLYDYMDERGGESVTDTAGVIDALYNPNAGAFYTMSRRTVKAWDAGSGQLVKVLRDVSTNEITAACLSENGRKIYLGDSKGRVCAHGVISGAFLTEFEKHNHDISCIRTQKGKDRVFTASWDGTVKVHQEEFRRRPQTKAEFKNHRDGVTCMACSTELSLLASGGTDMQVCLYDIKTLKFDTALARFHHIISGLDFLPARCLLAVADHGGILSMWRVRPHPDKWACVFHFRNIPQPGGPLLGDLEVATLLPQTSQRVPVKGVCFAGEEFHRSNRDAKRPTWLYTADAKGVIRCWDLTVMCERRGVVDVDVKELFELQRSGQLALSNVPRSNSAGDNHAHSRLSLQSSVTPSPNPILLPGSGDDGQHHAQHRSKNASGGPFLTGIEADDASDDGKNGPPLITTVRAAVAPTGSVGEHSGGAANASEVSEARLIYEAEGHNEAISTISLSCEPHALITCGHDQRVRMWSTRLKLLGTLLQNGDQSFRFPYNLEAAQRTKLEEANDLLRHINPQDLIAKKLPPVVTKKTYDIPSIARKNLQFRDPIEQFKLAAEQVISDPDADEEDCRILFEQMEKMRGTHYSLGDSADTAHLRLSRRAEQRNAHSMRHRCASLSKDEAYAAEALARAMSNLGADSYGTYSAMAHSLHPRAR